MRLAGIAITTLLAAGCTTGEGNEDPTPEMASEFSLEDVNPTSSTFGQNVSPRDHLGRASAWYFGHAT